ncbi:MAG TPA: MBL fold metallo-hydrolase [Caulobacteraceae bacterium]|jgi:phosphoribosyl 1,2-cyclic phosphate phosphodiesterase|nr:MBL fold metallo-hydrolase [Caulobacteraceae bacterium]
MNGGLEFTILGCGSSGGVPRADGDWGDCDPAESRNRRSRCSLLVRRPGVSADEATTVLVDTAPDLRLQAVAAGVKRVDAVLYTHDHADQVGGIDDLRAFYLRNRVRTPCYMDAFTQAQMLQRYGYAFETRGGYPAICDPLPLPPHGVGWSIEGPSGPVPVLGFDQDHGEIRSVGFRFGPVAYSSDVVGLPEASYAALAGVEVWIVDALRDRPHPTHAHVEMTLGWIERVRPARAILTNLHVDLDYNALKARLPAGVEPAYDGMRFSVEI